MRTYNDQKLQDELDATTLYGLLEDEIVPLFYDRGADSVPNGWVTRVKRNLTTVPPFFNTDRMVNEYARNAYEGLAKNRVDYVADRFALAKDLAERHQRVRKGFGGVRVLEASVGDTAALQVGDPIDFTLRLELGTLKADDLIVELVLGHTRSSKDLQNTKIVPLEPEGDASGTTMSFIGHYELGRGGDFSYGIRVRARQRDERDSCLNDLVLWA